MDMIHHQLARVGEDRGFNFENHLLLLQGFAGG